MHSFIFWASCTASNCPLILASCAADSAFPSTNNIAGVNNTQATNSVFLSEVYS